ncbi:MAG TPA: LamG domain-containing protein [Labilithrix sp.]|nr:LamG domain-containing protein [Labilithrix sp.]
MRQPARGAASSLAFAFALASCTLLVDLEGLHGGAGADAGDHQDAASSPDDGHADAADATSPRDGDTDETPPSAYREAVMADAPIAYWRLGETSGTTAKDEVGAHPGSYRGNLQLGQPGALSNDADPAVHFGGTTGYVELGDVFDLDGTPLTIEAWVQSDAFTGPSNGYTEHYVLSKVGAGGGGGGYQVYVVPPQIIDGGSFLPRLAMDSHTGAAFVDLSSPLSSLPTPFMHVVFVRSATQWILYVDAVERAKKPAAPITASSTPFRIGAGYFEGGGYWVGKIDEVAIYDHALTLARVQAHYDAR